MVTCEIEVVVVVRYVQHLHSAHAFVYLTTRDVSLRNRSVQVANQTARTARRGLALALFVRGRGLLVGTPRVSGRVFLLVIWAWYQVR